MTPEGVAYQPFYCEENVWHLCQHALVRERPRHVVFVSGPLGGCVMWGQRAARRPGAFVTWDYHVFLLVSDPWEIWDLDTTLGFPVAAESYLERSFHPDLPGELMPLFRLVPAGEMIQTFTSDRSHMRDTRGRYQRPPPPWPPIGPPGAPSNLGSFVDMSAPFVGRVLTLPELRGWIEAR